MSKNWTRALFVVAGLYDGILKNRELILYGMGLKAAYSALAFWHQLTGGIPFMWIPWAWADLIFLVLFIAAWKSATPGTA